MGERQLSRIWVWKECMMLVLVAPFVLSLPPGAACSPAITHHCSVAERDGGGVGGEGRVGGGGGARLAGAGWGNQSVPNNIAHMQKGAKELKRAPTFTHRCARCIRSDAGGNASYTATWVAGWGRVPQTGWRETSEAGGNSDSMNNYFAEM